MSDREQWSSQSGFILATIGSAVGLGNIWRFSYVAGENGGGAFLLLYLMYIFLIGLPLVIAELALGRRAQGDAIAAFDGPAPGSSFRYAGVFLGAGAVLILSYYSVIAGWALKYFTGAALGHLWDTAAEGYGSYFQSFISHTGEPVIWQTAMVIATALVVAGGVRGGIETLSRFLMPLLAVIITGLAIFAVTLPGARNGTAFLLAPDWSALVRPEVHAAALGQAFFSLGIGMAVFLTYGSYMPRSFPLPRSAAAIAIGDTGFAIVAGLAIFPAVFSFGIDPTSGPQLAFITLPQIFLQIPGGALLGVAFFFLLSAAALTSMVSLLEVPVAMLVQRLAMSRRRATGLVGVTVLVLGLPSAMSFGLLSEVRIGQNGILDAADAAVSNLLLPIGGILIALTVGWRLSQQDAISESELKHPRLAYIWLWILRLLVPLTLITIVLQSASML